MRDEELYRLPIYPLAPRLVQERRAPGLVSALWRWIASGAMHTDSAARVSRHTGGRI